MEKLKGPGQDLPALPSQPAPPLNRSKSFTKSKQQLKKQDRLQPTATSTPVRPTDCVVPMETGVIDLDGLPNIVSLMPVDYSDGTSGSDQVDKAEAGVRIEDGLYHRTSPGGGDYIYDNAINSSRPVLQEAEVSDPELNSTVDDVTNGSNDVLYESSITPNCVRNGAVTNGSISNEVREHSRDLDTVLSQSANSFESSNNNTNAPPGRSPSFKGSKHKAFKNIQKFGTTMKQYFPRNFRRKSEALEKTSRSTFYPNEVDIQVKPRSATVLPPASPVHKLPHAQDGVTSPASPSIRRVLSASNADNMKPPTTPTRQTSEPHNNDVDVDVIANDNTLQRTHENDSESDSDFDNQSDRLSTVSFKRNFTSYSYKHFLSGADL